jgi:hypothetical protein
MRVENSDFIAKRVAEGGYGPEPDSKLASELHRFIYEYDDADPYRSSWFMHRLDLVIKEARSQSRTARALDECREALTEAVDALGLVMGWLNKREVIRHFENDDAFRQAVQAARKVYAAAAKDQDARAALAKGGRSDAV